ncbi:MAG TPA: Sir2 family NAD-dependent protein deacetylase [Chitinophagales bacterium]|nr:Sir2 family NAD-dependent protein deacetylase [Chitinophagales bacterium]HRK27903.1 Sir2 family NAD-dependent protein deacetylase [Chitinophagales bacterium]
MTKAKHIVVLSGAGISAESGLSTFRGSGGMWEEYKIEEVASIDGWHLNPALVLEFYNKRRERAAAAQPNDGHKALAQLEAKYQVTIITQNVDDLHERAGSTNVLHLHGKLREARSSRYPDYVIDIGNKPIKMGDLCPNGAQLRPNIVWFGEMVPNMASATQIVPTADVFIVVGTSLLVYPAANLIYYAPKSIPKYLIDPNLPQTNPIPNLTTIPQTATQALPVLVAKLLANT